MLDSEPPTGQFRPNGMHSAQRKLCSQKRLSIQVLQSLRIFVISISRRETAFCALVPILSPQPEVSVLCKIAAHRHARAQKRRRCILARIKVLQIFVRGRHIAFENPLAIITHHSQSTQHSIAARGISGPNALVAIFERPWRELPVPAWIFRIISNAGNVSRRQKG